MEHESDIFIFHLKHWNVGMLEYAFNCDKFGQFKNYVYLCTPFHDKRQFFVKTQASMSVKIRSPSFSKK